MSYRGTNPPNTVQIWDGSKWVAFAPLTLTTSGSNATLTSSGGDLNLATGGSLVGTAVGNVDMTASGGNVSLASTTGTASLSSATSTTISSSAGPVNVTAAGNIVLDPTDTVVIQGNLDVQGTTTTIDSEVVNVADAYIAVGIGYSTVGTGRPAGLIEVRDGVAAIFATNITEFTGAQTAALAADPGLTAGDIIQLQGSSETANNGLFQFASWAAGVLTIAGPGTAAPYLQNTFTVTASGETATVQHVNVSVIRSGATSGQEIGDGNNAPLTFSPVGTGAGNNLQQSYDVGSPGSAGTIALTAAQGPIIFNSGTEAVNALQVQDASVDVLLVDAAGAVAVTPTSGQSATITTAGAGGIALNSGTAPAARGVAIGDFTGTVGDITLRNAGPSATGLIDIQSGTTLNMQSAGNMTVLSQGQIGITSQTAGGITISATGTGVLNMNAGAGYTLDGNTDSTVQLSANSAGNQTLTISATNAGAGAGILALAGDLASFTIAGSPGTSGQVLTSDGTNVSWQTPAASSETLQEAFTASDTASDDPSIDVTGATDSFSVGLAARNLEVTTAGAVSIAPTSGQSATITTLGAGAITLDSAATATLDGATGASVLSAAGVAITGGTGVTATATTGALALSATAGAASISGGTTAAVTGATGASVTATTGTLALAATAGAVTLSAGSTMAVTATTSLALSIAGSAGTSGQVLTSDGTNATWQTPAPSAQNYVVQTEGANATITAAAINANEITVACTAGGITISIPDPSTVNDGARLIIKDRDGSVTGSPANDITITSALANSIDGQTSQTIGTTYGSITLQRTSATTWSII